MLILHVGENVVQAPVSSLRRRVLVTLPDGKPRDLWNSLVRPGSICVEQKLDGLRHHVLLAKMIIGWIRVCSAGELYVSLSTCRGSDSSSTGPGPRGCQLVFL